MQKLFILFISISWFACSEVPVTIPDPGSGSTGNALQNVLIEEYTGVRCQNCPAGAKLLEELKAIHKERLIALSIHGGFFAQPTNAENKLTLDNAFGKELIRIFNQPLGYPSAVINRKAFDGGLFVGGNSWAGHISTELNAEPSVSIELSSTKNVAAGSIKIECKVTVLKETTDTRYLSIVLAENNIKDAQLTPTGVDVNYIHNHVMRKFITAVQGDLLPSLRLNESRSFSFISDIPSDWKMNDLYAIGIVNKAGPNYEVLQVKESK